MESTAVFDGAHEAWATAEYSLRDQDQLLVMEYMYDLRPNRINIAGPVCWFEVARLPPPRAVSSLAELEARLQELFELHPMTSRLPQIRGLIRTGLEIGPPLQVARLAARALCAEGVVEALVAALAAAGDDPQALAEVRHVARAAAPLTEVSLSSLIVRADSFGFNPPHLEWLLVGEAEYQEILLAWLQASREEPAARTPDEWQEEWHRARTRIPRARILDRLVRLYLRRLQSLVVASLHRPVAALPPPRAGWRAAIESLAQSLTPPDLAEHAAANLSLLVGSRPEDSEKIAQALLRSHEKMHAGILLSALEQARETPLVSLAPLLPASLRILRQAPDYDLDGMPGRNVTCFLRLLAGGTSQRDAREEQIKEYLRQQGDPFDDDDPGLADPDPQRAPASTRSEAQRESRLALGTFLVFILIGLVGLIVTLWQERRSSPRAEPPASQTSP